MAGTPAIAGAAARDAADRKHPGELAFRFELDLDSSPALLWPLVSDTNRFNRDAGVPAGALGVPVASCWELRPAFRGA